VIDVNVSLSRWPFRRLPHDEPALLVAQLRGRDVTQAWAGTFDGIFHKDLGSANARLAGDCRRYGPGLLVPFGSVNPKLPDWQEELRRCHEEHKMPGIRLHPNYHGYGLDYPALAQLLHLAGTRRLVVQLAVSVEDERTQHPLMRVPPVDVSALDQVVKSAPGLRLVILNADPSRQLEPYRKASSRGPVFFDCAMVEGTGGLGRLARELSIDRLLFGSHFPLFYFESALFKVKEAGFTESERQAILDRNARGILSA
jgi:predicted TIM-barrel fold metal-dependent hydrolase